MPFLSQFSRILIPSLYWLLGFFLLLIYASFKSILYFVIEDYYDLPFLHPIPSFITNSYEYGYMSSWLLFGSLGFLFCFILAQKLCKFPSNRDFLKRRNIVLWLIVIITFFSVLFDVLHITRSFLTGRIEVTGLIQTAVTFFLSLGIFVYAIVDLKQNFSKGTYFTIVMVSLISVITIAGITTSLIKAPPSYISKLRIDLQRFEQVDNKLKNTLQRYVKDYSYLPDTLEQLLEDPRIKKYDFMDPITKQLYKYKKISEQEYEISLDIQTDFSQAKRIDKNHAQPLYIKKGLNVLTYHVRLPKKNKTDSIIRIIAKVDHTLNTNSTTHATPSL